jgi:hypothetical protein
MELKEELRVTQARVDEIKGELEEIEAEMGEDATDDEA